MRIIRFMLTSVLILAVAVAFGSIVTRNTQHTHLDLINTATEASVGAVMAGAAAAGALLCLLLLLLLPIRLGAAGHSQRSSRNLRQMEDELHSLRTRYAQLESEHRQLAGQAAAAASPQGNAAALAPSDAGTSLASTARLRPRPLLPPSPQQYEGSLGRSNGASSSEGSATSASTTTGISTGGSSRSSSAPRPTESPAGESPYAHLAVAAAAPNKE